MEYVPEKLEISFLNYNTEIIIGIIVICIICFYINFKHQKIYNTSICVIIPVTSRNRNWKNFYETYLYNYFCKTFLKYYILLKLFKYKGGGIVYTGSLVEENQIRQRIDFWLSRN